MSVRKGTTLRRARPAEAAPETSRTVARVTQPPLPPAPKPRPSLPTAKSKRQQAADAVAELAAMRAEWPGGVPPWRVTPPAVSGLPKGKAPEVLTELPAIGTRVVVNRENGPQIGTVGIYEHYAPRQDTFPVRWGAQTTIEALGTVWALPRESQPLGRTPPARTGMCARLDRQQADRGAEVTTLPLPRPNSLVVEGTVLRGALA